MSEKLSEKSVLSEERYYATRLDSFTLALVAATVTTKGIGSISLAGIREAKKLALKVIAEIDA